MPDRPLSDLLDGVERAAEAATPGPWRTLRWGRDDVLAFVEVARAAEWVSTDAVQDDTVKHPFIGPAIIVNPGAWFALVNAVERLAPVLASKMEEGT